MMSTLLSLAAALWTTPGAAGAKPTLLRIAYDMNGVTLDGRIPTPGFAEQLQIQLGDPRVQIYFFSTRDRRWMEAQLRRIELPDGRRAADVARIIPGDLMNDLDAPTKSPDPWHAPVAYKDLRVISPDARELEQTILVDDDEWKAHPTQYGNLLWLPRERGHAPNPAAAVTATGFWSLFKAPVPETLNRRSDLMLGLIQSAIDRADLAGVGFARALRDIAWRTPPGPGDKEFRLSIDRVDVHDRMIAYGRDIRARARCAGTLKPEKDRP